MPALAESPVRERRAGRRLAPRRPGAAAPGPATLDDRITAVWTRLVEAGSAGCPVCGTEVEAARPCSSCGSELS